MFLKSIEQVKDMRGDFFYIFPGKIFLPDKHIILAYLYHFHLIIKISF